MGRPHGAVLLLGGLLQAAAQCNLPWVANCSQAATLALEQCKATSDKLQCCSGAAALESCVVTYGTPCGSPLPAPIAAANQQVAAYRAYLTSTKGYECLGDSGTGLAIPTTTVELVSGDSGSASGSGRSALSGSPSGSMMWQWVLLAICLCCCLAGIAGGGAYALMGKKKPRSKKPSRGYDDDMPPIEQEMPPMQQPEEQAPIYEPQAPIYEPQAPINEQPPPMQEEVQPLVVEGGEVQPFLFGPTPGLLPGPTNSAIVAGGPSTYSYPAMAVPQTTSEYMGNTAYYQAAPMTTSNYTTNYQAAPMTTSNYTTDYQVASPQTMSNVYNAPAYSNYSAPAYGNYTAPAYTAGTGNYMAAPAYTTSYAGGGDYGAAPAYATSYAGGGVGAAPAYATTSYAGGGVI